MQALPHPTSVRGGVVGFNLSPVFALCLFDVSSEGIVGFLTSVRISVLLLESGSFIFYLSVDCDCKQWLLVWIGDCLDDVLVHLLMKPGNEVVYFNVIG